MKFHRFRINELDRDNGRARYWHYMRRFLTIYSKDEEKQYFSGHLETIVKKKRDDILSIRFHIGNAGSETPWDGHFLLFGIGFFWGHDAFRKVANWLSKCQWSSWDSRDWVLRISDGALWWEFANHNDMCKKGQPSFTKRVSWIHSVLGIKSPSGGHRKRRNWRRGSINLSIPEAIWGPKRYTYEVIDTYTTTIKMPEDSYAVILKLTKQFFGRTKVARSKHIQTWTIDVDAPKGIPSHFDKSGGWKGDRTYGFGVEFAYPTFQGWQIDAENSVTAWVLNQRAKTGFREPQVEEVE